jgi:hypothetical protein
MRTRKVMSTRLLGVLAALAAMLAIGTGSATAITGGQADGNAHPFVGMVVTFGGSDVPPQLCSGTLMSPTIFVTAGHCTVGQTHAKIWFGPGPLDPSILPDGTGTPVTPDDFAFPTRDLGVIRLDSPITLSTYGVLPGENTLDSLKAQHGRQAQTFTTVGYGMQQSYPGAAAAMNVDGFTRMHVTPHLIQIDGGQAGDFAIALSDDAHTGGACFGDSGGPNFVGDSNVVGGVTSALSNDRCTGTMLAFRLDRSWALDWLATFGLKPPSSS